MLLSPLYGILVFLFEAGQRVIVVAGLPVHHYCAEDAIAEAYAMVFLVERGFAQQADVARAFARSVRTVRRYQGRYAQSGMAALGREEGWRRGRRRISGRRLRSIEMRKGQGMSTGDRAPAGVSEKAIRKLVGPSKPAADAQLAFAEIMTVATGKPPATGVPSARSLGDDADRVAPSAEDRAGDRDPIAAAADDGEPVPMSLDRDASDRTGAHRDVNELPHSKVSGVRSDRVFGPLIRLPPIGASDA
jgi:hypothetical protein